MNIKKLEGEFSVCQVSDYSMINMHDEFCFIGKTDEEISLVCKTQYVPTNATKRDDGWRCRCLQMPVTE